MAALLVVAAGCSSGGSDHAAKATTTKPGATSTTRPVKVVHPERDVEVVSCGKIPKIKVTNSTKKPTSYVVVVKVKAAKVKAVRAVGRVPLVAVGGSATVALRPLSTVPAHATCTVTQVLRTAR